MKDCIDIITLESKGICCINYFDRLNLDVLDLPEWRALMKKMLTATNTVEAIAYSQTKRRGGVIPDNYSAMWACTISTMEEVVSTTEETEYVKSRTVYAEGADLLRITMENFTKRVDFADLGEDEYARLLDCFENLMDTIKALLDTQKAHAGERPKGLRVVKY